MVLWMEGGCWLGSQVAIAIEAGWCLLVLLLQLLRLPGRPLGHDALLEVEGSRTKGQARECVCSEGISRRNVGVCYVYMCVQKKSAINE